MVKYAMQDYMGTVLDLDGRPSTEAMLWKLASAKFHLESWYSGVQNVIAVRDGSMT